MTIPHFDSCLDRLVSGPPVISLRRDDGRTIVEPLTRVGSIRAPLAAREQLEIYAVSLVYARFDEQSGCWERCLFSEPSMKQLLELRAEGQFPYDIDAVPSQAEAEWLCAQAAGATEHPPVPLRAYLTRADPELLEKLVFLSEQK